MQTKIVRILVWIAIFSTGILPGSWAAGQEIAGVTCAGGPRMVALVVDPFLLDGIRGGLSQFEADLCAAGYTVVERPSDFPSPVEVRTYLGELYTLSGQQLAGTILIGNIPRAYQFYIVTYANPNIPPSPREQISFQYYADLNGIFEASPGYASPTGQPYSFDVHGGDVNWEIWVGVLPLYKGDYGLTIDAINRYFAKNHAYRTAGTDIARAYLEVNEHFAPATEAEHNQLMQAARSGQYAWTPFSNAGNASIYFESPAVGMTILQGYAGLNLGSADFSVISTHGTPQQSGLLNIGWVESNPVRTIFFWGDACQIGNLDVPDNFLTAVLYSPTSEVLIARGSTGDSGGMGTNQQGYFGHNIASAMANGRGFGDAVLAHVNVPLIAPWASNREGHTTPNIILGDPTLTIRR